MTYEPIYERFEVVGPDGNRREINFVRAGVLTQGDRPELFFFRVNGEETVVGISGLSLARFERGRRRLSREQKIDVTVAEAAGGSRLVSRFPELVHPRR